jgi:hypothetical protein
MSWTRGSVSTSEERVRALRSIGHVGECARARVMQSRQKVCLHEAVVTGLTRADWQIEQTWGVSVCGDARLRNVRPVAAKVTLMVTPMGL